MGQDQRNLVGLSGHQKMTQNGNEAGPGPNYGETAVFAFCWKVKNGPKIRFSLYMFTTKWLMTFNHLWKGYFFLWTTLPVRGWNMVLVQKWVVLPKSWGDLSDAAKSLPQFHIVGAPSDSNSPSALSARAGKNWVFTNTMIGTLEWPKIIMFVTRGMADVLPSVRTMATTLVNAGSQVNRWVLVSIKDPEVNVVSITNDIEDLVTDLNGLTYGGGGDVEEQVLRGGRNWNLLKQTKVLIFVFYLLP